MIYWTTDSPESLDTEIIIMEFEKKIIDEVIN